MVYRWLHNSLRPEERASIEDVCPYDCFAFKRDDDAVVVIVVSSVVAGMSRSGRVELMKEMDCAMRARNPAAHRGLDSRFPTSGRDDDIVDGDDFSKALDQFWREFIDRRRRPTVVCDQSVAAAKEVVVVAGLGQA